MDSVKDFYTLSDLQRSLNSDVYKDLVHGNEDKALEIIEIVVKKFYNAFQSSGLRDANTGFSKRGAERDASLLLNIEKYIICLLHNNLGSYTPKTIQDNYQEAEKWLKDATTLNTNFHGIDENAFPKNQATLGNSIGFLPSKKIKL